MSSTTRSIILNGFDRSGSSAIARSLAQHESVELFMQPFNSGPVRDKMYKIWDDGVATSKDVEFFEGLQSGKLIEEYIKSHWFKEFSTAQDFVPGSIHIVKTTLNHFLIDWCQQRFPDLHQWAIWRNPSDILASLIRNDAADTWYRDALKKLIPTVTTDEQLKSVFGRFLEELDHPHSNLAFLISVRSYFLFHYISNERVIFYDDYKDDPINTLAAFYNYYGLEQVTIFQERDLNIVGKPFDSGKDHKAHIDPNAAELITSIFAPTLELLKNKFPSRNWRD